MAIDEKIIAHLQKLSRIEISPESSGKIASQLQRIITYIEQLQEADTAGVPSAGMAPLEKQIELREDVSQNGLPRDVVLDLAPDSHRGFFRVPGIFGKEEK